MKIYQNREIYHKYIMNFICLKIKNGSAAAKLIVLAWKFDRNLRQVNFDTKN